MNTMAKSYTFIDLFAGCGGLSEGFYRQGFKALAHVEIDHWACETLRERMRFYNYKDIDRSIIETDITSDDIIDRLDVAVKGRCVDLIIGGPPCQAYSTAGRVRDGIKMASDPRNYLFESYVRILEHYKPKFFVFENVTGILSAKANGRFIFPKIIKALGKYYDVIDTPEIIVHNTVEYGVPQIRKRIIIMGVRKDLDNKSAKDLYDRVIKTHTTPENDGDAFNGLKHFVDVRAALSDLPSVEPGKDASCDEFNYPCNNELPFRIVEGVVPRMANQIWDISQVQKLMGKDLGYNVDTETAEIVSEPEVAYGTPIEEPWPNDNDYME